MTRWIVITNQSLELILFFLCASISFVATRIGVKVSFKFNLLDYPTGRKAHLSPMPFLGGTAIFIAFWSVVFSGMALAAAFGNRFPHHPNVDRLMVSVLSIAPKIVGIFAGSLVILGVGLSDDKSGWTPVKKLAGQVVATLLLMRLGLTINLVSDLGWLGYVITFVWVLMLINAFNFIDSLDGHCAGVAGISTAVLFAITQIIDQPMVGLFLIAFLGSIAGFFPWNFKSARIFLGDNGSLFIGYMLAAFTLLCKYSSPSVSYVTVFIPVLVFGVPIYDAASVIIVRLWRGIAPWKGDRNHFAHRLVKMGMSDKAAVVFSYFIATTTGFVAVLTTQITTPLGALLIGLIFLSVLGVIAFLEYYAAKRARVIERWMDRQSNKAESQ